ncbi:MAG: hypothetical protein NTZ83_06325 [Candidatus Pacearchaeota archaeon]|nr:hypothetical protein [Candidatus Pacearchaeota archaeon]
MKKINYLFTAILIKSRFAFTRWIILTSFYGITLLLPSLASATNYYIKNTGNDSNTGLSDAQAWKTIAQVNSFIFSPGDSICFLRGNEWRELLRISQSGTDLKRITVTAYGTGAKPIINGADIITGWQETSANIWRVVNPSQVPIRSMVVIDGVLYTHVSTLGELQSANKYYSDITGGYIYVYKTSNPGLGISEISKREYGIRSKMCIEIEYQEYAFLMVGVMVQYKIVQGLIMAIIFLFGEWNHQ